MSQKTYSSLLDGKLTSRSDYETGNGIESLHNEATIVAPLSHECHYWGVYNGFAHGFNAPGCCIASLEDALRGLIGPERNNQTMGRVYVVSKPLNASKATWSRWTAKWSKRTLSGTAY